MIPRLAVGGVGSLNPIRGLLAFSEFRYDIRTVLAGRVYDMADVPRLYVPIYVLIRVPLLTLFGAAFAMLSALSPHRATASTRLQRRDISLLSITAIFPLACQVIGHGPAFTGLRHFLFVVPPLAALAGIGLDNAESSCEAGRPFVSGGLPCGSVLPQKRIDPGRAIDEYLLQRCR